MKKVVVFTAMALLLVFASVACGDKDDKNSLESKATATTGALQVGADAAGPALRITDPKNGDTVNDGSITVKVNVDRFKIVDKRGQNPVPGEGHLVYYLDTPN